LTKESSLVDELSGSSADSYPDREEIHRQYKGFNVAFNQAFGHSDVVLLSKDAATRTMCFDIFRLAELCASLYCQPSFSRT
jgi:hypothetical protein